MKKIRYAEECSLLAMELQLYGLTNVSEKVQVPTLNIF